MHANVNSLEAVMGPVWSLGRVHNLYWETGSITNSTGVISALNSMPVTARLDSQIDINAVGNGIILRADVSPFPLNPA